MRISLGGEALINKFDTAGIPVPPHHTAMLCCSETVQCQIEFEGGGVVRRRLNHRTVTVAILHPAGITAANAVNVKHRKLVDCNAIQGSTIKHRKSPQDKSISVQLTHPDNLKKTGRLTF